MHEELKKRVCKANLDLVAHGLVTLTWGNVSELADDRSLMAIKPSGVPYERMTPDQMVLVCMETGEVVDGPLRPSSDAPTHRVLYEQCAEIGGITHTHSRCATAFAQARREIPCYGTTHADHFHGPVPVTRLLTEAEVNETYEEQTGSIIVERFVDLNPAAVPGVLVAGQGPLVWGIDAADSVKTAVALEAVAEMALGTLVLAPDAAPVESYILDKHYFRKHGDTAYYGQEKR